MEQQQVIDEADSKVKSFLCSLVKDGEKDDTKARSEQVKLLAKMRKLQKKKSRLKTAIANHIAELKLCESMILDAKRQYNTLASHLNDDDEMDLR